MSAYEMLLLGYKNISVLRGGYSDWKRSGRPYELADGSIVRDGGGEDRNKD